MFMLLFQFVLFKIDVGTIYYEPSMLRHIHTNINNYFNVLILFPEHSFIHKWLLLTDAEDSSLGAKVSLSILLFNIIVKLLFVINEGIPESVTQCSWSRR